MRGRTFQSTSFNIIGSSIHLVILTRSVSTPFFCEATTNSLHIKKIVKLSCNEYLISSWVKDKKHKHTDKKNMELPLKRKKILKESFDTFLLYCMHVLWTTLQELRSNKL